jgi:hypothetical protein
MVPAGAGRSATGCHSGDVALKGFKGVTVVGWRLELDRGLVIYSSFN